MMKYSNNVVGVLTALECSGIGKAWIVKNFTTDISDDELLKKLRIKNKISDDDFYEKKSKIIKLLDDMSEFVDGFIAWGDEKFPYEKHQSELFPPKQKFSNRNTKEMKDTEIPVFFAYKGDLSLLNANNLNIAVIGLLNPKEQIKKWKKKL